MGTVRRATALIAVPLLAALTISPAAASGASGAPPTAPASARVRVGGPQLNSRGVVFNRAKGITAPPRIDASSYVIVDADTGQVLAAKDPHGHYLPASALKTLTSVTLIPKLDRNGWVRPTQKAVDVEGTKVGMTAGWHYRVSDLFKAMLMVSGNDAALSLTEANGGLRRTLAMMNAEARRLQANDTLAASPNGLDVDLGLTVKTQYTSAYDLALILRQGMKLPDFRAYVGTVEARFPAPPTKEERKKGKKIGGYPIYTHDRLLRPGESRYPGMIGGKNGYTNAAQQTFVGAARRGGHTIIIALMHSSALWSYASELLDWGFAARGRVQPVGALVDPVPPPQKAKERRQDQGALPASPARGGNSGVWGLATLGAAGAVGGGLALVLWRRQRPAGTGPATGRHGAGRPPGGDRRRRGNGPPRNGRRRTGGRGDGRPPGAPPPAW
jgi:D-alanyl-D-alanine carboxypeptidase (penicillin-binding protein 5/6)